MNQKNYKKSKIIKIFILLLLIMLIATCVVYSFYVKKNGKETLKNEFFRYIGNHDLNFFIENPIYSQITEKLAQENYASSTDVKMATTMENNMFSKLDLAKFELHYDIQKDNKEDKYYNKLDIKYLENPVLVLDFLINAEQFAVKSDEIVSKYVGINRRNLQNTANQLWETEVNLLPAKKLKNFVIDREPIQFEKIIESSQLANYMNLAKEIISNGNFSKKENVLVTLDSEQIQTTEYTVELDNMQTNQLWSALSKELSQDDEWMNELVVKNVQNFEEESGVLDYIDNDNVSEIRGEENNFNTSLSIWGENTAAENTITNQTNSVDNRVENNTVTNNTAENVTQIGNQIHLNTTENNTVQEENIQETENDQSQEQEIPNEPTEMPQQEPSNTATMENRIEEDNVRRQGFIGINEETENPEEESFIIGENYEETLKNIEKLVQKIDWTSYLISGARANCSQEELAQSLQAMLEKKIEENNRLKIKLYVQESRLVKLNFELLETEESLDIEFISKAENEKYLLLTLLKGKEEKANGSKITLYKKEGDAITKTKINIHKIHQNKIHQKLNFDFETRGTINSKKFVTTSNIVYSDREGEFKVDLENSLNFDTEIQIDDLKEENCLFIDSLAKEELLNIRDAIKQKVIEVLGEKNRNLNMIDMYHSNPIVQQTEQPLTDSENDDLKQQIKEVLIQTLRDKMREYLDHGTNLTIADLEGLVIPGYEVEVSISSNLAIITVNGFRFNLDSDFNLSDS